MYTFVSHWSASTKDTQDEPLHSEQRASVRYDPRWADLKSDLVAEVDAWGVPAGMKSRVDTIRKLLKIALEMEGNPAEAGRS